MEEEEETMTSSTPAVEPTATSSADEVSSSAAGNIKHKLGNTYKSGEGRRVGWGGGGGLEVVVMGFQDPLMGSYTAYDFK